MKLNEVLKEAPGSELPERYYTLNDASIYSPILAKGKVEIWYGKPVYGRDLRMGVEWLADKRLLPKSLQNLKKTHTLLGKIKGASANERGLETIWSIMQGEKWSPRGEAIDLIKNSLLNHTSMSVGDIIVINRDMYIVDDAGFENLSDLKI